MAATLKDGLCLDGVDACHAVLKSPDWEVVGQRGRVVIRTGEPCRSDFARRALLAHLRRDLMYATDVVVMADGVGYLLPAYAVDNLIRHILEGDS